MMRKFALASAVAVAAGFAGVASAEVAVGQKAPAIEGVQDTTGAETSLKQLQGKKATVIAFTCCHCPVAVAYEDRFVEFAKAYKDKGVNFVAVNANAGETIEEMKERAEEKDLPYPYVLDADSSSAKDFGATRTPELYVLDGQGNVVYHGAFDSNMDKTQADDQYVVAAVEAVLAGKKPTVSETKAVGCGIRFAK
jgi:peroxiredoxin